MLFSLNAISMCDALVVNFRQACCNAAQKRKRAIMCPRRAAQVLTETSAVDEFHQAKRLVIGKVVDASNVRMRDATRHTNLTYQALDLLGLSKDARRESLQGKALTRNRVIDLEHFAHSTSTEELHNAVPVDDKLTLFKPRRIVHWPGIRRGLRLNLVRRRPDRAVGHDGRGGADLRQVPSLCMMSVAHDAGSVHPSASLTIRHGAAFCTESGAPRFPGSGETRKSMWIVVRSPFGCCAHQHCKRKSLHQ